MAPLEIVRLTQLPAAPLQPLLVESTQQGETFVARLVAEYLSGANQFKQPGEALFGIYTNEQFIAIGGLNRDPFVEDTDIARVRHVYVLAAWRRQGVGKQLVQHIMAEARQHFRVLTLRTFSASASAFYCALGFQTPSDIKNATHHLVLRENAN